MAEVRVPVTYQTVRSRCRGDGGDRLAGHGHDVGRRRGAGVDVDLAGGGAGLAEGPGDRVGHADLAAHEGDGGGDRLGGAGRPATGGRGAGWSGVGWSGAGVAEAAIDGAASPGGLVSRVLQPATATLATRRAAAMVRTGRMLSSPLWAPGRWWSPTPYGRRIRSQLPIGNVAPVSPIRRNRVTIGNRAIAVGRSPTL